MILPLTQVLKCKKEKKRKKEKKTHNKNIPTKGLSNWHSSKMSVIKSFFFFMIFSRLQDYGHTQREQTNRHN